MAKRPKNSKKKVDLQREAIPSDAPIETKDMEGGMSEEEALLKQCSDRLDSGWSFWETTFNNAKEDVSFAYEDQWPSYAKKGRDNRPMLTMNMLPQYAQQVVNATRQAKFAIQVKQIAGKNEPLLDAKGTGKPYSRSQIMEGLVRDIEDRSKAHDCYSRAAQHQVEGGFSWLLIKTMENIDDPFDIELGIHHIKDRYAAMIDPFAKREDKSDANWCSVSMDMERKEFEARWPDLMPQDWDPGTTTRYRRSEGSYWRGDSNTVRVTDYWWKQPMDRTAVEFIRQTDTVVDRLVMWEDEHGEVFDELKDQGFQERNRKEVQSYKVRYMRCTYSHILDGPHDWPSKHLPLVMVNGREINLEDQDHYVGLFRYVHDAQRMLNFWMSAATEKIALVPRSPFVAAVEQIAGQQDQWDNMYTSNRPVLLYNNVEGVAPPQRQSTVAMAQGELQLMGSARSLLQDTIGVHDASLGRRSNEVSGVAMQERQERGAIGTYDFVDNLAKAVVRVGEILVDMIPRCYTTDYVRRVILPDDSEIFVDLNMEIEDEETGKNIRVFTLDFARYSCRVDVGPASKTQREEFVQMMIEWGRSDPEGFSMFRDLIVANMDIPQARVIAQRMKAAVPYHMLSEEDKETIPPPEPSIEDQLRQMEIQAEMAKAEAEMVKAQTSVQVAQVRAESDQTRLQFEQEKGLNRAEKEAEGDGEGDVSEEQIASIVKREVAKALASKK